MKDKAAVKAACQRELATAFSLIPAGTILERFDWVTEQRGPVADTSAKNVFMTQSWDATTHFQSVMDEIFAVYEKITGTPFDLKTLRSTKEIQAAAAAAAEAAAAAAPPDEDE